MSNRQLLFTDFSFFGSRYVIVRYLKAPTLSKSLKRIEGFTLMEVLIAMAIGSVVLIGAFSYFGVGIKAMQTNDTYARMHESASKAASIIGRDLQLSGFYGYGGSADQGSILGPAGKTFGSATFRPPYPPTSTSGVTYSTDCDQNNIFALERPLEYYPTPSNAGNASEAPTPYPADTCFPNHLTNSAILIMRGALTGESWEPTSATDTHYGNNTVLITASPFSNIGSSSSITFFFGNPTSGSYPDYGLKRAWDAGFIQSRSNNKRLPIFPYQFYAYYIRSCNLEATTGTELCDTANGADTMPTLVRRQIMTPGSPDQVDLQTVRLIPGVQQMRFIWGMDTQGDTDKTTSQPVGDGVTDYWSYSLPSTDFNKVNTVRMQILVQAVASDIGYDDSDNMYFFEDTTSYNCGTDANAEACRRRRILFEATTSLRNCSLRRRAGLITGGGC